MIPVLTPTPGNGSNRSPVRAGDDFSRPVYEYQFYNEVVLERRVQP